MNISILENIKSPEDLKKLDKKKLRQLAWLLRQEIISVVSENGGHLASNLGVVELTIALHRVFKSPKDAIIWDVGHQCYTHKLLTGRFNRFNSLRKLGGLSGFPKQSESEHDFFDTGHSSTSISSALGLNVARRLQGQGGKVVAVIGDGALTGGMALEALAHGGQLSNDLIVVLNDNDMSIGKNTGAIAVHLSKLTTTMHYQKFRHYFDKIVAGIPFFGSSLTRMIFRLKRGLKGLFYGNNLFVDLGFEYVGPLDGHNISEMEDVFLKVKNLKKPVVVHVKTKKGKGFLFAENDPANFHGIGPFNITDGKVEKSENYTFTEVFSMLMTETGRKNPKLAAVTAAMTKGTGLSGFRKMFPERFFDVGIAEQHEVTFAAGLSKGGLLPVAALYSTFLQRAIDQVIHDVALQNLHVIFALDRAGPVPHDGETHQGLFDISLLLPVPNIKILSPATMKDFQRLFDYACKTKGPVVIRYPKAVCPPDEPPFNQSVKEGEGVFVHKDGSDLLIICTGGIFAEVKSAANSISRKRNVDIYSLRFIKPVNIKHILNVVLPYRAVLFIEDGIITGGIGKKLESIVNKEFPEKITKVMAFSEKFYPQGSRKEILNMAKISRENIKKTVQAMRWEYGAYYDM